MINNTGWNLILLSSEHFFFLIDVHLSAIGRSYASLHILKYITDSYQLDYLYLTTKLIIYIQLTMNQLGQEQPIQR